MHEQRVSSDDISLGKGGAPKDAKPADSWAEHAKTVADSAIEMARMMQPDQANIWGNVHGGTIMRLADEAGGAVAIRHAHKRCVTVAMDSMTFKEPVYIGDLLIIHACLTSVGRTSMEVEARIEAENLLTGKRRDAGTSYLVYVAIDDAGRPTAVPPLRLETPDEHARWGAAQERQRRRGR